MNTDKELMRFIRAAVKNGGSVNIRFFRTGKHIMASVENAYMILPNEEEEVDIITLTPAAGEDAETVTIIRGKEEKEVEEKETLF